MTEDDGDMAVTSAATIFPVVLYDGEREMNVGNMKIHTDLTFKQFQLNLSQMIGISYNNLTSYLVDNKNQKPAVNSIDRRKILITGKVNFAVICRQVNCHFLVVLKRSRRGRRRKIIPADDLSRYGNQLNFNEPQTTSFSPYHYNNYNNNNSYYYNDEDIYIDRYRNDRDYVNMMMMNLNMNMNFPAIEEVYGRPNRPNVRGFDRSLCSECKAVEKQGIKDEFHCCVYDEVVVGFSGHRPDR